MCLAQMVDQSLCRDIKVSKGQRSEIDNNKVSHLSQNTTWESDKTQYNITHKRSKRFKWLVLSQQMTTRPQRSVKKALQTRNVYNKSDHK